MRHVESEARSLGITRLVADVSITARSFFEHAGFRVVEPQTVERRGVRFQNYRMEKSLSRAAR
jgi:putative acetyltransferase